MFLDILGISFDTEKIHKTSEIGRLCDNSGRCAKIIKKKITPDTFKHKWPFKIPQAFLVCAPEQGALGQVVVVGGLPWAGNGGALAFFQTRGVTLEINSKKKPVRYFDVDENPAVDKLWAQPKPPKDWPKSMAWEARVPFSGVTEALDEMGCKTS